MQPESLPVTIAALIATMPIANPQCPPFEQLVPSSAIESGCISLSTDGLRALVGDFCDDSQGNEAGRAMVFRRQGTEWTEEAELFADTPMAGARFGEAVVIVGDTAFVGAPLEGSGAVYVFGRRERTWEQTQKLFPSNPASGGFGAALASDGGVLLAGAPFENDPEASAGAAYFFEYSGASWIETQRVAAVPPSQALDAFGFSTAILGDVALIGALQADGATTDTGAAFVLERSSSTWSQTHRLKANDGEFGDSFGVSVALVPGQAIVGVSTDATPAGQRAGSVRVFDLPSGAPTATLLANDGEEDDRFGFSIAAIDDLLFVGAILADHPSPNTGAAYAFAYDLGLWSEFDVLVPENQASAGFGIVGLAPNNIAFLAGSGANAVYSYFLGCEGTRICSPGVPNSTGLGGELIAFGTNDATGGQFNLLATALPPSANLGYFIAGTGSNTHVPPGAAGPICVGGGALLRLLPPVSSTAELSGGFERNIAASAPQWSQITAGSTWNFQAWHRDGMNPSNFTNAVSVTFQ